MIPLTCVRFIFFIGPVLSLANLQEDNHRAFSLVNMATWFGGVATTKLASLMILTNLSISNGFM